MNPLGLLLVAAGLFSAAGGIFDWDWFMNHRKARLICAVLTRTGARAFYVLIGLGVSGVGMMVAMGIIQPE